MRVRLQFLCALNPAFLTLCTILVVVTHNSALAERFGRRFELRDRTLTAVS